MDSHEIEEGIKGSDERMGILFMYILYTYIYISYIYKVLYM